MRNPHTDNITRPISEVLTFLFTRYGFVNSQRLKQEEDKVTNFSWNISDTPVVISNLIEDLEIIAEAARNSKSDTQLVNYGIDLVRDTGEFETSLLTWFARPDNDQIWENFKSHFTLAHIEVAKVRDTSMRGTVFHQANATVEALTAEMVHIRDELVESINSLSTVIPPTDMPPALPSPPQPPISTDRLMNATVGQQTLLEVIQ